ncbi:hypothetical protein ES703_15595 [subsurface metagenome]
MKRRIFKVIGLIFLLILVLTFAILAYRHLITVSKRYVGTTVSEEETKVGITTHEESKEETIKVEREFEHEREYLEDIEFYENTLNKYEVFVKFLPEDMKLQCNLQLEYTNFEDDKLDKLYFHLYPRAYDEISDSSFKIITDLTGEDLNELDIIPGKMVITKLFVNGVEVNYKLEQTLCEIDLEKSIEPGESLEITMEFYQDIPKNRDRYGYYYDANQNEVISLGNWCPILAVYDDEGWHKDPFLPIGDPFYSDSSIYEVKIMLPEDYVLASTGELFNKEKIDDYVTYTYQTYPVRDFAIIFSKDYSVLVDEYQDIDIYSYLVEEDLEKFKYSINWAKEAISIFSELFGKYTYQSYSIAQNFSNFGGMEYPQLCQIKYVDKGYRENIDEKYYYYRNEYVVAHETAHQWWYSVVGNNEIDEPWLDEAFAEYSTCQYFINKYGEDRGIKFFSMIRPGPLSIEVPSKVMNKTIRDYTDFRQYSRDVYGGGAELLFRLEEHLGRDVMYEILREYFEEYKFENVDITGFINICEEVSGKDLSEFFSPYFNDL